MKLENSMTFQIFHEPYKLTMFKYLFLKVQFVAVSGSETCKDCLKYIVYSPQACCLYFFTHAFVSSLTKENNTYNVRQAIKFKLHVSICISSRVNRPAAFT